MSLHQLSQLLPLPEPELQQVLDYAATLSKEEAAGHWSNLLGESPQAIEFISSFNSRRQHTGAKSTVQPAQQPDLPAGVPKRETHRSKKKKAAIHTPAPRQIHDTYVGKGTAYVKKNEDDYVTKRPTPPRSQTPTAFSGPSQPPQPVAPQASSSKQPPSAAGTLISNFRSKSTPTSRTSSPVPKTKINITGGTSMHGASKVLDGLDSAIRSLEISTNGTLQDNEKRKCNCIAARHPLLTAAPNCLNCGKVICVKEGLGPCTFCGQPLLSAVEVQDMISVLREERGRERMLLDSSAHRKAAVSKTPLPFAKPVDLGMSPAEAKAKEHRDRLLGFQAQNVQRTTVRDEASDFETGIGGRGDLWASPSERVKQLKMQQKVLAEQEWNARPEYEKRRQVLSIGFGANGKVVKRVGMGAIEKANVEVESEEEAVVDSSGRRDTGGTFSRNPLLGNLIKPVYDSGKGKENEGQDQPERKKTWRRVQGDLGDNEAIILDGGTYGRETDQGF